MRARGCRRRSEDAWCARRTPPCLILSAPRPDSGLCGVGRQKRPFCSTHSLCAHVWLACEPAKSESKAGQRATGKTGSVEVAQLAAARFFLFFFRTARDGHVHTGDPSAADANMSPTLR